MTQSTNETELLRETLIDLERSRNRERDLRLESEGLLKGLRILALEAGGQDTFNRLLDVLQPVFGFQDAFVVDVKEDGSYKPFVWTNNVFRDTRWQPQKFFERLFKGRPAALFDVTQTPEWSSQPSEVLDLAKSALHIPLQSLERKALMICTHPERGYFGQQHLNAARRFVPLALQALMNVEFRLSLEARSDELARVNQELRHEVNERKRAEEALSQRILALTRPTSDLSDIRFSDLFNVEEIQRIQDAFSDATGVASIITDPQGNPLTSPSNYCRLCRDVILKTEKGMANCRKTNVQIAKKCSSGAWSQHCYSGGMMDAGASICIGDQQIAVWLVGQVRDASIDTAEILTYAKKIGADPEAFAQALDEVQTMTNDQFQSIIVAVNLLAKQLSTLALQNVQQAREIYERQQKDAALRTANAKLQTLIQAIPDVIFFKDAEGRNQVVNRAFEQMFGLSQNDILNKFDDEVMPAALAVQCRESDQAAIDAKKPVRFEEQTSNGDGQHAYLETIKAPIFDDQDRFAGLVGVSRDVTERKLAEQERERLEEQLLQSQKMEAIGRLAGGIAHDFNNILTGINGYAEMLLSTLSQEDAIYADVAEILSAGKRAAGLTNQLLAFSRKQVILPKVVQLNKVVERSKNMLARLIGEDVELRFEPGEGLWPVRVDPAQIDQILINLAVNARDAMPDGGRLKIETGNIELNRQELTTSDEMISGRFVGLVVGDNGQGMPADVREHVFEPFFSTKGRGEGTGLGLATVYGIVSQNNGYIDLQSTPGEGATFTIYLPVVNE